MVISGGNRVQSLELAKLEKSCLKTGEFTLWTKGKIRKILIPKSDPGKPGIL